MPKTSERVFPQINYDKLHERSRPSKIFKKYLELSGLDSRYSPKWFRHSFATNAMRLTKNPILIKEILGHSSISTTDIYTHPELSDFSNVSDMMKNPLLEI